MITNNIIFWPKKLNFSAFCRRWQALIRKFPRSKMHWNLSLHAYVIGWQILLRILFALKSIINRIMSETCAYIAKQFKSIGNNRTLPPFWLDQFDLITIKNKWSFGLLGSVSTDFDLICFSFIAHKLFWMKTYLVMLRVLRLRI